MDNKTSLPKQAGNCFFRESGGLVGGEGGNIACGALGGDAAKDHEVGHGVAAKAVGTMDTTSDLTGGEQAGDGGAVLGQDFGGGVDLQAAMVWCTPGVTLMA